MKVYFVRHGETNNAAQGLTQKAESELSEKGIKQAEQLAESLRDISVERILCSTYERARETADIINKHTGLSIEYLDDLVELRKPSEIQGKSEHALAVKKIKKQVFENFGKENSKVSDEENFFDLKNRGLRIYHYLKALELERVLVVSHGTIIRMIVAIMMFGEDVSYEEFLDMLEFFGIDNTGVSVCAEGGYRGWKLLTWNHTSHLF